MESTKVEFDLMQAEMLADRYITENATIDPLSFGVTTTVENGTFVRIWMDVQIVFNQNGRNDQLTFTINFNPSAGQQNRLYDMNPEHLQGGAVTCIAYADVRNNYSGQVERFSSAPIYWNIKANQPKGELIRSLSTKAELSVLMYVKSSFSIFNSDGWPAFDKGFGLLRNIQPTALQIWNWKKDIEAATAEFKSHEDKVKNIPQELRNSDPNKYAKLPDFTKEQIKIETWQSFGTGLYYKPVQYTVIFIKKWRWEPAEENDGFANTCLKLEKEILSGKPPVNW